MQSITQTASFATLEISLEPARSNRRDDWAYQASTVAAILLVLVSLWVF
jgi:hypothetical protein